MKAELAEKNSTKIDNKHIKYFVRSVNSIHSSIGKDAGTSPAASKKIF